MRQALLLAVLLAATPAGTGSAATNTAVQPAVTAQVSSGCVVDPADMIGWWRGEDDLTAEVGPDLSGTVAFTDAHVQRGMDFTVTSGPVEVPGGSLPTVDDGVSVEAWVRPSASRQARSLVSRWTYVGGEGDDSYALLLTGQDLLWMTDDNTLRRPLEVRVAAPQLFDGGFHHVAATWSSDAVAVYVDGQAVLSQPSQGGLLNAADSTPLRLGSSSGAGDPMRYTGVLDEPTVYARALTPTEVAAIHAAGSDGKCSPAPPEVEQAKLTGSEPGDWFGRSVAIDGDTAVVGANLHGGGGIVHVYTRTGTTWSPEATLVGSDTRASDDFGFSVAVSGDTIVVGAFEHDVPTGGGARVLNSGAAYVFVRGGGGGWTQQAKLVADVPTPVDNFGRSVDVDGDTIVVGNLFDDEPGKSNTGAAFVFARTATAWTQEARLTASDTAGGDGLGFSVAVERDTVLASADLDDDVGGADSGSVYVFTRAGTTWTEQAKLRAVDAASGDRFGSAVDLDGRVALIGAEGDDDGGLGSGSAYAFVRSGSGWVHEAKLTAPAAAAGDRFGFALSMEGGVAVIGAYLADLAGPQSGAAFVYTRSAGGWAVETPALTASDAVPDHRFGIAVAIDAGTALIGATGPENHDEPGAAYVVVPMA